MNIELKEIPICDLVDGYENNQDEGVYGYGGKLNIRPKYQREFVYGEKEQKAVINSVFHGFPLNVIDCPSKNIYHPSLSAYDPAVAAHTSV